MRHEHEKLTSADAWSVETELQIDLPSRLRLLCVGATEPSWISLTLQLDAEECQDPQFRWVSSAHAALTLLRDASFDCILISDDLRYENHGVTPDNIDAEEAALPLIPAIRASGCDDPVVFIASTMADERWEQVYGRDCELLITTNAWESRALVPAIKRAFRRVEIMRENRRLIVANHRRLIREREEASHLLEQQRQMIDELQAREATADHLSDTPEANEATPFADRHTPQNQHAAAGMSGEESPWRIQLPNEIHDYYHELLRTYVIMGSGSLGAEIAKLSEVLFTAGLGPREGLELHLERVECLVRGLGNRSTRHVMARADLLALELMMHLGERYQQKLKETEAASNLSRRCA